MGSLEKTVYYIVVFVAILNIIAYLSDYDWQSVLIFIIAGGLMYLLNPNITIDLLVAIFSATIFKSVYIEGMKTKPKPKTKIDELKDLMNGTNFEGLQQKTNKLVDKQKELLKMASGMGPMMKQANEMMSKLPEGFLEQAMENFKKNNKNNTS